MNFMRLCANASKLASVKILSSGNLRGSRHLSKCAWIAIACVALLIPATNCEKNDSVVMPGDESAMAEDQSPAPVTVDSNGSKTDRNKVFFFGTVISTDAAGLLVEIAQPETDLKGSTKCFAEVLPGRGIKGKTVRVKVNDTTAFAPDGVALENLTPGTPIMAGGLARDGALSGHFVVDLRQAEENSPSPEEEEELAASMNWSVTEGVDFTEDPKIALELKRLIDKSNDVLRPGEANSPTASAGLEFPGSFGGPGWVGDTGDLDIVLLLIPYVEMDRIVLTVGLAGGGYNFPFSFNADGTAPLFVGQTGDLEVQVEPQSRSPYTYSWALGFNIAFHIKVCFILGCDSYVYDFNLFSLVNQTTDPAPMPGEQLDIEAVACPSFDVSMGIIDILGIEFCEEQVIEGDFFTSDVDVQNTSSYSTYYNVDFNGTDPMVRQIRPYTNPLNVVMDDFEYYPNMEGGIYARAYIFGWTIYQFPTIPLGSDNISFIPTNQSSCDWYGSWLGTCGDDQPSSLQLVVPTIPVVTSISSAPNPSRYGEMVTVQALVRGANGPATGPKEVTFYDGNTPLATVPIGGNDVATLQTSALTPCMHTLTAEYIGYDASGNAYPSRKTLEQVVTGAEDWTRREGYWQHQCNGNGSVEFDDFQLECYLSIVEHMSLVFSEERDISTADMAHDVLFLKQNGGSTLEQLDRELLTAWLNYANGGIAYNEMLDSDNDGIGDTSFLGFVMPAEAVRLNPNSSVAEIKEQTSILHHLIQMQVP